VRNFELPGGEKSSITFLFRKKKIPTKGSRKEDGIGRTSRGGRGRSALLEKFSIPKKGDRISIPERELTRDKKKREKKPAGTSKETPPTSAGKEEGADSSRTGKKIRKEEKSQKGKEQLDAYQSINNKE